MLEDDCPKESYSGVYLVIEDHDRIYEAGANESILLNNFDMKNEEDQKRLDRLLYTEYEGDSIDTVPSCECGAIRRVVFLGERCGSCGTLCLHMHERPMKPILWAKVPDGVHGFVEPTVWTILNGIRVSKTEVVRWMCDPIYQPPNKHRFEQSNYVRDLVKVHKWKRSLNHFIENFDWAMEFIFKNIPIPKAQRLELQQFIEENKHKFFPKYLPIPNKTFFIVERTKSLGIYLDKVIHSALDGARTITSLNNTFITPSQYVKENKVVKTIVQMAEFYTTYDYENLAQKPGHLRRQKFGARLDFSGRAVITSIQGPHDYREIHFPWSMSVLMLKSFIDSKLQHRGYTPNEAEELIMCSVNQYNTLIDEIFKELIAEAPDQVIKIVFQRNPSLKLGSAQQLDLPKIKTDPNDPTISLSQLVLNPYNADFDGDEMNARVNIDQVEAANFSRLKPSLGVMDVSCPFKVSGALKMPTPPVASIMNWLQVSDSVVFADEEESNG